MIHTAAATLVGPGPIVALKYCGAANARRAHAQAPRLDAPEFRAQKIMLSPYFPEDEVSVEVTLAVLVIDIEGISLAQSIVLRLSLSYAAAP